MRKLIYQYYVMDDHTRPLSDWAQWSQWSVKKYAEKYGWEYEYRNTPWHSEYAAGAPYTFVNASDGIPPAHRWFDITRVWEDPHFDQYDLVLFLDLDVVIHPRSPDISVINPKHVAGWVECVPPEGNGGPSYDRPGKHWDMLTTAMEYIGSKHPYPTFEPTGVTRIFNSGVLLWSKEARLIAREKFGTEYWKWWSMKETHGFPRWLCLDQIYISAMLNKYNLESVELNFKWNSSPDSWNKLPQPASYFYHFSNARKKMVDMWCKQTWGDDHDFVLYK
jgi:hypothetical protein